LYQRTETVLWGIGGGKKGRKTLELHKRIPQQWGRRGGGRKKYGDLKIGSLVFLNIFGGARGGERTRTANLWKQRFIDQRRGANRESRLGGARCVVAEKKNERGEINSREKRKKKGGGQGKKKREIAPKKSGVIRPSKIRIGNAAAKLQETKKKIKRPKRLFTHEEGRRGGISRNQQKQTEELKERSPG